MTNSTRTRPRNDATIIRGDDSPECRAADAKVAVIIEDVLAGRRSDPSARGEIAGILCSMNIFAEVAATAEANQMEREELEERLRALMLRKILVANGTKHLNFEKLRGRSACGWLRQFARAARQSELRNLRTAQRNFGVPIDHTTLEGTVAFSELAAPDAVNTPFAANLSLHKTDEEIALEESASNLIEEFTRTARYLRGDRVIMVKADVLRRFLNLPNARRLPSPADRDYVLRQLNKDEKAAYKSASVAFRLKTGDLDPADVTTDKRLIAIWENHDVESLEGMLERPGEVAHTLAVVASMQRPRPNSVILERFRRQVSVISDLPEWADVADRLAAAYIATEFSPLSSYNEHRLTEDDMKALEAKHQLDQKNWKPACREAAKFIGAPAGKNEQAIRRTLDAYAVAAGAIEPGLLSKKDGTGK